MFTIASGEGTYLNDGKRYCGCVYSTSVSQNSDDYDTGLENALLARAVLKDWHRNSSLLYDENYVEDTYNDINVTMSNDGVVKEDCMKEALVSVTLIAKPNKVFPKTTVTFTSTHLLYPYLRSSDIILDLMEYLEQTDTDVSETVNPRFDTIMTSITIQNITGGILYDY